MSWFRSHAKRALASPSPQRPAAATGGWRRRGPGREMGSGPGPADAARGGESIHSVQGGLGHGPNGPAPVRLCAGPGPGHLSKIARPRRVERGPGWSPRHAGPVWTVSIGIVDAGGQPRDRGAVGQQWQPGTRPSGAGGSARWPERLLASHARAATEATAGRPQHGLKRIGPTARERADGGSGCATMKREVPSRGSQDKAVRHAPVGTLPGVDLSPSDSGGPPLPSETGCVARLRKPFHARRSSADRTCVRGLRRGL